MLFGTNTFVSRQEPEATAACCASLGTYGSRDVIGVRPVAWNGDERLLKARSRRFQ